MEEKSELNDTYCRFKQLVDAQPAEWRARLKTMHRTDPQVAIAAWTLILSMENLMLEIEETAALLERLYYQKIS